jgi:hypothetical protein
MHRHEIKGLWEESKGNPHTWPEGEGAADALTCRDFFFNILYLTNN